MRPWKIVLSSTIAAICAAAAMLRPGLTGAPDGITSFLLPRLPALVLTLIAVYALVAIVSTAGGLIAAALDLGRHLGRTNASSQAAAALDWIAAFDETPLHTLVPRPVGALPKSARHGTTILLDTRFDPREARAEAAHLYYLWLARTHSLGALVGLGAIVALGFAQGQGEAAFLAGGIPTGPAALVLVGLLLLGLLGRFAIDVTIAPIVDAVSRLPWEQVDAGRLRYAVDLLETARIDAVTSGRSVAGIPSELPERLTLALEDGGRALAAAGERLSIAAEKLGAVARSAIGEVAAWGEIIGAAPDRGGAAPIAALQAAIEGLTAQLDRDAMAERVAGHIEEDWQALAAAIERLSAAAETQAVATRSAIEELAAVMRENLPSPPSGEPIAGAVAAPIAALQAAIEGLTAQLDRDTVAERVAGRIEEDWQALAAAIERLSAAANTQAVATRSAIEGLAAVMRENLPSPPSGEPVGAAAAPIAALQAAIEGLTVQLDRGAMATPVAARIEEDRQALAAAIGRLSAATETEGAATRLAIAGLAAVMRENLPSPPSGEPVAGAAAAPIAALQAAIEGLTAQLDRGAMATPVAARIEEDRQALAAAIGRLSTAAEIEGAATRSAIEELAAVMRESLPSPPSGEPVAAVAAAPIAALQAAIGGLTAQLDRDAMAELVAGRIEEDRQALTAAIERLSAATETEGAATRSAIEGLAAVIYDSMPLTPSVDPPGGGSELGTQQTSVEALTAELEQLTALFGVLGEVPSTDEPESQIRPKP
jgi:hypothetical protein